MSQPALMLLTVIVAAAVVVLLLLLILWAIRRWLGPRWELGIALVAVVYLIYDWMRLARFCSAEPTYNAPTNAEAAAGSEGTVIFNCDAPGGAMDYLYLQVLGPGLIFLTLILSFRAYWHLTMSKIPKNGGVV